MSKAETLTLPEQVDAATAARLWRDLAARTPGAIDFARVKGIDSAGLALVAELCAKGGVVLQNVPERFVQLCAAHRIDKELLG